MAVGQIEFDPAIVPAGVVHGRVDADRSRRRDRLGYRRAQPVADRLWCGQPDRTRLSRCPVVAAERIEFRHGAEFSENVERPDSIGASP